MTILQRLTPVSALAVAFLLLGCDNVPTANPTDDIGDQVLLGKGGGKPGGSPATPAISFAAGGPGDRNLSVMDADGGNVTEIYSGSYLMHSSWSGQGNGTTSDPYVILVSMSGAAAQPLEKLEVVVVGGVPTVQNTTTLSSEARYHHAVVGPGGQEFVAVDVEALGGGGFRSSLVLGDMATGAVQLLYQPVGDEVELWQPDWNADGTRVAFFEKGPYPNQNVAVRILDMTTQEVSTAFSFSYVDWGSSNLSWARTSNELLLDVDRQLYRVDLDVAEPALGSSVAEGLQAVWSPDDTQIAYWNEKLYIKTFGAPRDKVIKRGGQRPDWRR